jgi:hypothetical protein
MSLRTPDYTRLRAEYPFTWYVGAGYYALLDLVPEISLYDTNVSAEAMIELYRKGIPLFEELFDDRVPRPALTTPAISYAHVNGLGVDLVFPEFGEVNYEHTGWSLDRLIAILEQPIDWRNAGMMPTYIGYRETMRKAFPGKKVGTGLSYEGPMTTAYELRDSAVFTDVYDEPERFKQFLGLMTESIIDFAKFRRSLDGTPAIDPSGTGMCDDLASMFAPSMWDEFVLPYQHQYYDGLTTGTRSAHIEDLRPDHLPFLEELGLVRFDPSISPKISPVDLRDRCRVPFGWRLGSFHYATMDETDVRDWVFKAVADGASFVFTHVSNNMTNEKAVRKLETFMAAAEQVKTMLAAGASATDLLAEVTEKGKYRFWETWPD